MDIMATGGIGGAAAQQHPLRALAAHWRQPFPERRRCLHSRSADVQHAQAAKKVLRSGSGLIAAGPAAQSVSWRADAAPDIAEHVRVQRQHVQLLDRSTSTSKLQQQQPQQQQQYLPKTRGRLGAAASGPGYFGARAMLSSSSSSSSSSNSSNAHQSQHSWGLLDGAAASIAGSGQPWLLQLKARVARLQQEATQHSQRKQQSPPQQAPAKMKQGRQQHQQHQQQQPQQQAQQEEPQQPSSADAHQVEQHSSTLANPVDPAFERWWAAALLAAQHWKEAAVLAHAWPGPLRFGQLEFLLHRLTEASPLVQPGGSPAGFQPEVGGVSSGMQQLDRRTEERVHGLRAADWHSFCSWLGQQLLQQLEAAETPVRKAFVHNPSRVAAFSAALAQLDGAGVDTALLAQLVVEVPLPSAGLAQLAVLGCGASDLGLLLRGSWLRSYARAAAARLQGGDGASAVGVLWALARYKQVPANEEAAAQLTALAEQAVACSTTLQPSDLRRLMVATAQLQLPAPESWKQGLLAACHGCLPRASVAEVVQLLQGIAAQGWRPEDDWWAFFFAAMEQRVAVQAAGTAAMSSAAGEDGAAAAMPSAAVLRRQQHEQRQQQERERRMLQQEGDLGDAHPADEPQQQQPRQFAAAPPVQAAEPVYDTAAPSSQEVVTLLMLLLELDAKPSTGWTTRLLEAHCRGKHDASLLPQLLALLPQVLPDPKLWAPHNKDLLDKLLQQSGEECLQQCGPQQLVEVIEALAELKHRPGRPFLAWLSSATLRLGRAFPMKPLLRVRTAYLQLDKEPPEPRLRELFYAAYQKMVDRAKARERAEARAAGRKSGVKPSNAELARTWRQRKLKPPGTLKRVT